ncbi:hypothetical protein L6R53_11770 [Myxococcota bacterium]|nr:hypothetical protein [Myxococcota bacterium]
MPSPPRTRIDLGETAALTWIAIAVGLTVVIGPSLGLRGWAWLGLHHALCLVGTSHELWRARKRRAARQAQQEAHARQVAARRGG